jgi:hypothetical protein
LMQVQTPDTQAAAAQLSTEVQRSRRRITASRSAGKRLQMRVLETASRRLAASGSWAGRITKPG